MEIYLSVLFHNPPSRVAAFYVCHDFYLGLPDLSVMKKTEGFY